MRYIVLVSLLVSMSVHAENFQWFEERIEKHDIVKMLESKAKATEEMGEMQGSWGDPMFKIAANNFPKDSMKKDETPMTGIQYSVMQKIGLTTKYGNLRKSYQALSESIEMEKEQRKRLLKTELWKQAIGLKKIEEDLAVLRENLQWIEKMIRVSKKLYSNGKLAQQGLLEIQIRKNNVETKIIDVEYKKKEIDSFLGYLSGNDVSKTLDLKTVPWEKLEKLSAGDLDFQEKKLKKELEASELNLKSSKLNYVPDVTVGVAYTKRANIDNKGDFVGASISFPLPLSGKKYANHSNATQRKMAKERAYRNYQIRKRSSLDNLEYKEQKLVKELEILKKKTLNFAKSARDVTSRSYRLGNASYIELLNAEINYQNYLLKKTDVESRLNKIKIERALLAGGQI